MATQFSSLLNAMFSTSNEFTEIVIYLQVASRIEVEILHGFTCGGRSMWKAMLAQIAAETKHPSEFSASVQAITSVLGVLAFTSLGYCVYRFVVYVKASIRDDWYIAVDDIVFYHTSREGEKEAFVLWPSVRSLTDVEDIEYGYEMMQQILQWPGKLNHRTIGLRLVEIKTMEKVRHKTRALLLWMKDSVSHSNVLQVRPQVVLLVGMYS